jgi:hypothetical protein
MSRAGRNASGLLARGVRISDQVLRQLGVLLVILGGWKYVLPGDPSRNLTQLMKLQAVWATYRFIT